MSFYPSFEYTAPQHEPVILRDYQFEAVWSIYEYFQKNDGNPLILMPTGTGKSLVIAGFIKQAMADFPGTRFLVLTHVKELLTQNFNELIKMWPNAPAGIFSAGLKSRDIDLDIIFGGIQSVANAVQKFGYRDIVFIDECHLLSPKAESTYQKVIAQLKRFNPKLKIIGLTATGFRLGLGMLTDGSGIFTDIALDLTTVECWNRFIAEGHLVPPIALKTAAVLDISNVGLIGDDYNKKQLEAAVDKDDINYAVTREFVRNGENRRCWLTFASGIAHAEHLAELQRSMGVNCAAIHTDMAPEERDRRYNAWLRGELRSVTNNNVLTTGVNNRMIDYIGMCRPTTSASLWVQMVGRGTRTFPGKLNCLVPDFARNAVKLGPVNDPCIPRKKGAGGGDPPIKLCDACGAYNHISARHCIQCGQPFEIKNKLHATPGDSELLRSDLPVTEMFGVVNATYVNHTSKKTGSMSIRIDYFCDNMKMYSEWINFSQEQNRLPLHKAHSWWRQRYNERNFPIPKTNDDALRVIYDYPPRRPSRLRIWTNKRYPEILGAVFE